MIKFYSAFLTTLETSYQFFLRVRMRHFTTLFLNCVIKYKWLGLRSCQASAGLSAIRSWVSFSFDVSY